MQRTCFWIASAIVTASGVFAVGDEAAAQTDLKGAYGFTGTGNCLVATGSPTSPPGFDSSLQPISGPLQGVPLFSFSFAVAGTRTFNGDGTGTVKGTAVSTTSPNFKPNASSDNFTFHFTYVVNLDGSWTSDLVPGTYMGTFVAGPRLSQTYTIDKLPTLSGLTGVNGLTLTAATTLTPTPEIHTYSNGDVWPMICYQSHVFIKLQPATN